MNIGNHQILGKRIQLKNNILVCQKFKEQGQVKIKILKIIKEKILFNSRPTPILTNGNNGNSNSNTNLIGKK